MQITVKIEKTADTISIVGESKVAEHTGEMDALAIRDLILAPTGSAKAQVSEIFLTRYRDKATPKLAEACSMGDNIGLVTIYLLATFDGDLKPFLTYTLTETFVSRVEHETVEANGGAYLPHQGFSGAKGNTFGQLYRDMSLNQNADRPYTRDRARPNPVYSMPMGVATDKEVERIWLSPETIKWTYTLYDSKGKPDGNIEKGWNLQTSKELA